MKLLKTFESFSDNLLEILIFLEEIQKKLSKSVNVMSIQLNDDNITFEYHSGVVFPENIGKVKSGHYEKVKISENKGFILEWLIVFDETFPHYTPEKLLFQNIEEVIKFLNDRYYLNRWMIDKKRIGRYLIDDGISDIPKKWR